MAPRPIGELISIISSSDEEEKVVNLFIEYMDEVFSHPQKDITNHLVHLSDKHATSLRIALYTMVIKQATSHYKDDLLDLGFAVEEFGTLNSRLCRRYNASPVYDDIYALGISLVE